MYLKFVPVEDAKLSSNDYDAISSAVSKCQMYLLEMPQPPTTDKKRLVKKKCQLVCVVLQKTDF